MVDPGASERRGSSQPKLERPPRTTPRSEPREPTQPRAKGSSAKTCTSGSPTTSASAQASLQAPSAHASQTLPFGLPSPIVAESATSSAVDRIPDHYAYESIDRAFKANLARLTFGLSPAVLGEQFFDWLAHIAISPGKQLQLSEKWFRTCARFNLYATQSAVRAKSAPCAAPLPNDWRFRAKEWQQWPYNLIYQSFLLTEEWWLDATTPS